MNKVTLITPDEDGGIRVEVMDEGEFIRRMDSGYYGEGKTRIERALESARGTNG